MGMKRLRHIISNKVERKTWNGQSGTRDGNRKGGSRIEGDDVKICIYVRKKIGVVHSSGVEWIQCNPLRQTAQRRPNGCLPSAAFLNLRELRSLLSSVPVLLMQVHSSLVSLSSPPFPSYSSSSPQNILQPSSPRPPSPANPAQPTIRPPHLVHPTNEEIDAVIQQATSSVSADGRHVPLKDTRTQLFVGNVRSFFVPPLYLATRVSPATASLFHLLCSLYHSSHHFLFCIPSCSTGDWKRARLSALPSHLTFPASHPFASFLPNDQ